MNRISIGLKSYGTIYGTVQDYTTDGILIGAKNLSGYGVFFSVRKDFSYPPSQLLFYKSVGTGITITDAANGKFSVYVYGTNTTYAPAEYAYECFLTPEGTTFTATTQLKGIGSGIFEITQGVTFGTT